MSGFLSQLKWQFALLQKNNIISISLVVTLIYGVILFFLNHIEGLNKLLVALVLNDPSVIGYFFIALALFTETKQGILSAILVSPLSLHLFLISRVLTLSILGTICSLGLAISVVGLDFFIWEYTLGSFAICAMSALLGVIMIRFADEFLKFAMISVPVFLIFINLPMLVYLKVVDLSIIKYVFPIQGSIDFISYALDGTDIHFWYSYGSLASIPIFYGLAYRMFIVKIQQIA
ncbi:hypothetical protein GYB22_12750 [bacterium]|nr:hypothetical protein [bacterium]